MLGLGLGFGKISGYKNAVKKLIDDYIKRVTAAGGYLEGTQCATDKLADLKSKGLLDDASWILVPQGIKEDVVYAQKPTSGLGDLVFTRASDATRTNSEGVIERTPWNLVTWSEIFSDVAWAKNSVSISANTTTAPNGTLTADTLSGDGVLTSHLLAQTGSATSGVTYTHSVYAKKGTNNFIQLAGTSGIYTAGNVFANFDLNNGVLGTVGAGSTATITNVGNGWYRCTMTATATASSPAGSILLLCLSSSATSTRAEGNSLSTNVFIWGAQLVEGTDAKTYFATTNRQDVPRLDYRNADGSVSTCPRLLLEPQRTNSIRNSTMVGAVAGSPGTLPTNWTQVTIGGLTRTIVGAGTENGISYIDVRYNGTATGGSTFIGFETVTGIAAANGQTWTGSFYAKTIAAPSPPTSFRSIIAEYNSAGVYVRDVALLITPTSNLNRFSQTETLAGGVTTARVLNGVAGILTIGETYDFTIRIAAPQMELGAYATTFIPTTTAAVTRLADAASKTGVSSLIGQTQGTLFVDVDNPESETAAFVSLSNASASVNNHIWIGQVGTNIALFVRSSGTYSILASSITSALGVKKIALAYGASFARLYVNGTQVFDSTAAVIPSGMDKIEVNNLNTSIDVGRVSLAQAALFPTRLTNAQLVDLTGGRIYYNPVEAYYAYYLTPEIPSAVITSVNSFF
jgi:hypothetical protein